MTGPTTQSIVIHATSADLSPQQIVDRMRSVGLDVVMVEIVYPPVEMIEVDDEAPEGRQVN